MTIQEVDLGLSGHSQRDGAWQDVCGLDALTPERGAAAMVEGRAVALFRLDDGIEHVRRVVMQDSLGLGAELEAQMAAHVESYECEWAATLRQPDRLAKFQSYVNEGAST